MMEVCVSPNHFVYEWRKKRNTLHVSVDSWLLPNIEVYTQIILMIMIIIIMVIIIVIIITILVSRPAQYLYYTIKLF